MVTLNENLVQTETSLRLDRESLMLRVQQIDLLLEHLRDFRQPEGVWIPPVKPDEFKGQRAIDALESYLRARRECGRIPFTRAVEDLVKGGAQHGASRGSNSDPARLISHTLKIGLPNKTDIFDYSPFVLEDARRLLRGVKESDIHVWLAPSADEPKIRKRSRKESAAGRQDSTKGIVVE